MTAPTRSEIRRWRKQPDPKPSYEEIFGLPPRKPPDMGIMRSWQQMLRDELALQWAENKLGLLLFACFVTIALASMLAGFWS